VLAAAELAEHPDRVGRISGFAEQAAVQDHLGVGAEHHRRARRGAEIGDDGQGLGQRDRGDGLSGRDGRRLLGDVAGQDIERDTEAPQQLPTARGGRGEDETGGAQVTIRGFLSVMMRSFFSIDSRRNLGRLKQCRCAFPSQ